MPFFSLRLHNHCPQHHLTKPLYETVHTSVPRLSNVWRTKLVKRGIEWNKEKKERERTNGRRVGLRGIEGMEGSIWREGWRWGVRVCVCVWRGGGGGGGWSWWGVEVRATEWHSVNCGLMKVLIMELVTFQPLTDPVSLIDPLWSVTRRHYWSVPRSRSARPGPACTNSARLHATAEPDHQLKYHQHLLQRAPVVSSLRAAPINRMIEEMEGQSLKTVFQSVKQMWAFAPALVNSNFCLNYS